MAEALENRILYSAAPADIPQEVAHEITEMSEFAGISFEPISSFFSENINVSEMETYFAMDNIYNDEIEIDNQTRFSTGSGLLTQSLQSVYGTVDVFGVGAASASLNETVILSSLKDA